MEAEKKPKAPWKDAAEAVANKFNADVLFYNGQIERMEDHKFIVKVGKRRKRENLVLVLVTPGGDAHAAFRIARAIQRNWKHSTLFIPGWCKSAGTLLAIGANELVIGDAGEMGPIDVQRAKPDELWESTSGLTEDAAIESLERAGIKMFENFLLEIKQFSGGQITFKTAAESAAALVAGVLAPLYAQIDPFKIGENSRAMKIGHDYGMRLGMVSNNLKSRETIEKLTSSYSSHGFVIDREEASQLFKEVRPPCQELLALCDGLGDMAFFPNPDNTAPTAVAFLNSQLPKTIQPEPQHEAKPAAEEPGDDAGNPLAAVDLGRHPGGTDGSSPSGPEPSPPANDQGQVAAGV